MITTNIPRFRWAKTAEVIAAAQELEAAGELRLAERLRREARAERLFHERYAARQDKRGGGLAEIYALLPGLAEESCEQGYPASSVSPLEIMESPSFRDYLGVLVAQRRADYSSVGELPDRIAVALFGKRKGGRPPLLADLVFDRAKLELYNVLHKALVRAHRELFRTLTDEKEILENLRDRGFELRPPSLPAHAPAGWSERYAESFKEQYLPGLARELSGYRKGSKSDRLPLHLRALRLAQESRSPERRYGPPSEWTKPRPRRSSAKRPSKPDLDEHDRLIAELNRIQKRFSPKRNPRT